LDARGNSKPISGTRTRSLSIDTASSMAVRQTHTTLASSF
jgi:hypothetical protein